MSRRYKGLKPGGARSVFARDGRAGHGITDTDMAWGKASPKTVSTRLLVQPARHYNTPSTCRRCGTGSYVNDDGRFCIACGFRPNRGISILDHVDFQR